MTHIMAALDAGFAMGVAQEEKMRSRENLEEAATLAEEEERCKLSPDHSSHLIMLSYRSL